MWTSASWITCQKPDLSLSWNFTLSNYLLKVQKFLQSQIFSFSCASTQSVFHKIYPWNSLILHKSESITVHSLIDVATKVLRISSTCLYHVPKKNIREFHHQSKLSKKLLRQINFGLHQKIESLVGLLGIIPLVAWMDSSLSKTHVILSFPIYFESITSFNITDFRSLCNFMTSCKI